MIDDTTDELPDFDIPWLQRWRDADFSWAGLAKHSPWLPAQSGTLQDYLRRLERNASDEDLVSHGVLIDCGAEGFYHPLFVPDEWVVSGKAEIAPNGLLLKKQQHWDHLFAQGGIREQFRATVIGAHLLGGADWVGSDIDWRGVEEGLGYSLNRTIPIGVFADEGNVWRKHLLGSGGQISHIAIRTLATCQSVISAILIYLGVMAVRRKFRIS